MMNKREILKLIISDLNKNLEILINSAEEAKQYSTSEESKAENKYDTRGLEASYLAGAQSKRAEEFKETVFQVQQMEIKDFSTGSPIGISALVQVLVNDEEKKWFFLLPASGMSVDYQGQRIQTVTLQAPLGIKLLNKSTGDEFSFNNNDYEILEVY